MPDQVTELAERGRSLAPDDRVRVSSICFSSLHEPLLSEVEAAWEAEIERRLAEYDRGEVEAIDADEVFAKARSIAR